MTGIKLIIKERKEQISKHGHTKASDRVYVNKELVKAALCALEKVGRGPGFTNVKHKWPSGWDEYFERRLRLKNDIGKLIVAGALFMAENDRLRTDLYQNKINTIAKRIDRLNYKP